MALVNEHFLKLPNNYLFSDIAKKVNAFKVSHAPRAIREISETSFATTTASA